MLQNTPVVFEDDKFVFKGEVPLPPLTSSEDLDNTLPSTSTASGDADSDHSPVPLAQMSPAPDEAEDDVSIASRTDDDLIREVMVAALSDPSGEEEDDVVVWSPARYALELIIDNIDANMLLQRPVVASSRSSRAFIPYSFV